MEKAKGLQKEIEVVRLLEDDSMESKTIKLADWTGKNGQKLRAEGWTRVEKEEEDPSVVEEV
jgi:hypothetical protein